MMLGTKNKGPESERTSHKCSYAHAADHEELEQPQGRAGLTEPHYCCCMAHFVPSILRSAEYGKGIALERAIAYKIAKP